MLAGSGVDMWIIKVLVIVLAMAAFHFIARPILIGGINAEDAFIVGFLFCAFLELIEKIAKVIWERT